MRVWRICGERYAEEALSGNGGLRHGARWHFRGTRIVYTSESLALAALEFFVNLETEAAGMPLVAVSAEIPETAKVLTIRVEDLSAEWRAHPAPPSVQ